MNWKPIDNEARKGQYVLLYQKSSFFGKEIKRYSVGRWARPLLGSWNWYGHNGYPCNVYASHYSDIEAPE